MRTLCACAGVSGCANVTRKSLDSLLSRSCSSCWRAWLSLSLAESVVSPVSVRLTPSFLPRFVMAMVPTVTTIAAAAADMPTYNGVSFCRFLPRFAFSRTLSASNVYSLISCL